MRFKKTVQFLTIKCKVSRYFLGNTSMLTWKKRYCVER